MTHTSRRHAPRAGPARLAIVAIAVWPCAAAPGFSQEPAAGPASRPAMARLAAEGLLRSAESARLTPGAPGGPARRRAPLEFAAALTPGSAAVRLALADACRDAGDTSAEADALRAYLAARPHDHAAGVRWLRARRDLLNTAEERVALFRRVARNTRAPAALRAEALLELSHPLAGMGRFADAREALDEALRLDPRHAAARSRRLDLDDAPAPADRARAALALLAAGADAAEACALADDLHALGLHAEAAELFAYARRIARPGGGPARLALEGLADALLDAGRYEEVLRLLGPPAKDHPGNLALALARLGACRALGRSEQAAELLPAIEAECKARGAASRLPSGAAREVAVFHLRAGSRPAAALEYARRAYEAAAAASAAERRDLEILLGAAELKANQTSAGLKRLRPLAAEDIHAAAFLAEHHYAAGAEAAGRKALLGGLALGRGGWAYRRLRELAAEHKVDVPPLAGAAEAAKVVAAFDRGLLAPALEPQRHLEVAITPVRPRVAPGEPVEVVATLTHVGRRAVPLAGGGPLTPVMALRVTAAGEEIAAPAVLPVVRWPAPPRLEPGRKLTARVRLDVGPLARTLAARPLDEMVLTIGGVLSPAVAGKKIVSRLPAVKVAPATVIRLGPLGGGGGEPAEAAKAYEEALERLSAELSRGKPAERLRAVRQVASLLAMARAVEQGRPPPAGVADGPGKGALLAMVSGALKDPLGEVRAELLACLAEVDLDEDILKRIAAAIGDDEALVRLRAAELIGASASRGREKVLRHLAADEHRLVRQMASAFLPEK
jgi:hypothetical protein